MGTGSFSDGKAGDVKLFTSKLRSVDGGTLGSTNAAAGTGGDTTINANFIKLKGANAISFIPSSIGNLTFGTGSSGKITVDSSQVKLLDGASIFSSSVATGNAGSVEVNASESIEVKGDELETQTQSSISSSALVNPGMITITIVSKLITNN